MAHSTFLLQPVGPKAGTPGAGTTAAPGAPEPASSAAQQPLQSQIWLFVPMLALVAFMLFSSRSQRKREQEVRAKLKKGDRVVSQSGLIGELIDLDDRVAKVKIAPGTTVSMLASTISPFDPLAGSSSAASGDKKAADVRSPSDAKAAADKKG